MSTLTFDIAILKSALALRGESAQVNAMMGEIGQLVATISHYLEGSAQDPRLITQIAKTLILTEQMLLIFERNPSAASAPAFGLSQGLREARFLCGGVLSALSTVLEPKGSWIRPYVAKRICDLSQALGRVAESLGIEPVQAEITAIQDRLKHQILDQQKPGLDAKPTP